MVEVRAVGFPRSGRTWTSRSADRDLTTGVRIPLRSLRLSEARRAWNRERIGLVSELLCECTRPTCRDTVPAVANTHRSMADHFLVAPAHVEGNVVIRAADRFFIVASRRSARGHTASETAIKQLPFERPWACVDLNRTAGFRVADARGRAVGRVEGPVYRASAESPEPLSVRFSVLRWRRRLVPADAIEVIDDHTRTIGLRIERSAISAFV